MSRDVIKDCESVFYCSPTAHRDVLAAGDEFAAALSRVSLTSSSMTSDFMFSSKPATRSRSASHRSLSGLFNWMRASSSSRSPLTRRTRTDWSVNGYDIATSVSLPHVAENHKYSHSSGFVDAVNNPRCWKAVGHSPCLARCTAKY